MRTSILIGCYLISEAIAGANWIFEDSARVVAFLFMLIVFILADVSEFLSNMEKNTRK